MNERLKLIRSNLGKTQKEFGSSLGVSRDTYASYESGRVIPNATFIQLLCSTYNVNKTWLKFGKGNMFLSSTEKHNDTYTAEYAAAQEIAELLSRIKDSNNRNMAKAQIKSFLEGFIARGIFCGKDDKSA